MKNVVITGSTRGIGQGLADAFLDLGCRVTINGRRAADVEAAVAGLGARHDPARVHGRAGSVADLAQVEALWQAAQARFGPVDVWINNAGIGHKLAPMWELPPERVRAIVDTNILGLMYGSRVAIRGMLAQGHGQLYNMEGAGSRGHARNGMSVYATSKAAVHTLSEALINETRGTTVQVGTISPGMVVTDLLVDPLRAEPATFRRNRRVFNTLANRVETVTPVLAQRILANTRTGARIRWLSRAGILWRFLTAPLISRDPFGDQAP